MEAAKINARSLARSVPAVHKISESELYTFSYSREIVTVHRETAVLDLLYR